MVIVCVRRIAERPHRNTTAWHLDCARYRTDAAVDGVLSAGYTVPMERAHFYIAGIVLILFVAVLVVAGVLRVESLQRTPQRDTTRGTYTTFTAPPNIFASLTRTETRTAHTASSTNDEVAVAQQREALQRIIREWEARPGSSDARTARATIQTADTRTPEQRERDEVRDVFNELIGTKITDSFVRANPTDAPDNGVLWWGAYTDTRGTIPTTQETPTQRALHAYGNELGSLLSTFNITQGDQVALLESFLKNRTDTERLKNLTDGYVQLSSDISRISAPEQVRTIHARLVTSYKAVGELLWNLTTAASDEELLDRMLTYNKASEAVAKQHVALVTLFKAHGVVFQDGEPGSIFSFDPSAVGGLSR